MSKRDYYSIRHYDYNDNDANLIIKNGIYRAYEMKNVPDSSFGILICYVQTSEGLNIPSDVQGNVCIFQMYINTSKKLYYRIGNYGWTPWITL